MQTPVGNCSGVLVSCLSGVLLQTELERWILSCSMYIYTFNSACNSISYHILYMSYPVAETLIIRRCECVDYCMYDL